MYRAEQSGAPKQSGAPRGPRDPPFDSAVSWRQGSDVFFCTPPEPTEYYPLSSCVMFVYRIKGFYTDDSILRILLFYDFNTHNIPWRFFILVN